MADWIWVADLTDPQRFEVFKILLEKGLLAVIVAIAGGTFAILLERYKSALKKQEELSKVIVPQILDMLEAAETLYEHGTLTLRTLDEQASSFLKWERALIGSNASIKTADHYRGPDDLKRPIVECDGEMISLAVLLERTAPDDLVKSVLKHPEFAVKREASIYMEFLYALYETLKMSRDVRLKMPPLASALCSSIFVPLVRAPRDEYSEKMNKFVLAMMRRLPIDNPRQRRAYDTINKLVPRMRDVINEYPTLDVIKFEGLQNSFERLAHLHAAVVSQLRAILNAV
jgi:hypothetical protein